jgi:two-component sensor histidine kinase
LAPNTRLPEVALSLALAVIASSTAPLLLLDGDCRIIAASGSFATAFGLAHEAIAGQSIFALGNGEWDVPRLRSLLAGTLSGAADIPAYEIDLKLPVRGKRRLVLHAHKLAYSDGEFAVTGVRVLLAVADVTDARQRDKVKDELLREKATLLQEIQHRIANSLQIIASVLMQSARKVGSEESRIHLRDAHNRVMAVAELERQLAESQSEGVDVVTYLSQLCQSLGASMIEDHDQITLGASGDDSLVTANVSVSLGLIVTELVINALKHGFPDQRKGQILVEYRAKGDYWTLTVGDDGVGMPEPEAAVAGLGTNIVNALARHLRADVTVTDGAPGTIVSVAHKAADQADRDAADVDVVAI